MHAFRRTAVGSWVAQLGRRYRLATKRGAHDVLAWLSFLHQRARIRIRHIRAEAPLLLERTPHRSRELVLTLITAAIGGLLVAGFLEATDEDISPVSALGGAFTVDIGDNGMPYIAIDPEGLGQNEAEPMTASGDGKGGESGSSLALLLPISGDLFGGDDPPPGTDPQPSPDPRPTPVPSPSPSPSPDPSPGPSPSPEGEPSPSPDPSPEPEPSPSTEPSPSPEPSPPPKPTKPTKPPKPSPSPGAFTLAGAFALDGAC